MDTGLKTLLSCSVMKCTLFSFLSFLFQILDRNTKLTARNGREIDALVVFSHSIRYLKDRAIEIIREVTGDEGYSAMDMQWVLTVPAIWKPAAKQFMREAAYQVNN